MNIMQILNFHKFLVLKYKNIGGQSYVLACEQLLTTVDYDMYLEMCEVNDNVCSYNVSNFCNSLLLMQLVYSKCSIHSLHLSTLLE